MAVSSHLAENQRRFKLANESIERARREFRFEGDRVPFLCECPDFGCTAVVALTPEEYWGVRADPNRFLLLEDHLPAGEGVVERRDCYVVSRKAVEA